MKLLDQTIEFLTPENYTLENSLKIAELAGRTAYKSEDKITEDSYERFCNAMKKSQHFAVLEHATIYLMVFYNSQDQQEVFKYNNLKKFYTENPYSYCYEAAYGNILYITTNYRVILEHSREDDLRYISMPQARHVKRYTYKCITNRQVANEIVRHRAGASYLQESTRYCDYNKEKFNNELNFIKPWWFDIEDDTHTDSDKETIKKYLGLVEMTYQGMKNLSAQEKAQILPLSTKTEIVMTLDEYAWEHFFDLRLFGKTGAPHPQMKQLAEMIFDDMRKRQLIMQANTDDND